jgi:hypothetical protein
MQLHCTSTDPTRNALVVCRNVRWNLLVLLAIFWAIPVFWWYVDAPIWVTVLCAALPAFLTWPLFAAWRRRGRPDNWVLAIFSDGIWLNLRDCDYHEAAHGDSIVHIPFAEIASARRFIHRYTTPSGNGSQVQHKDVYLQLELETNDGDALRLAIEEERRRDPPPRQHFGGAVTSRTRRTQAPIDLAGDTTLRVKFSVANYGLRPSLKRVLAALKRYVRVEADLDGPRDDWKHLDDSKFDDLVRCLVRNGERINAMNLLERRRNMSATEAKKAVDELSVNQSA